MLTQVPTGFFLAGAAGAAGTGLLGEACLAAWSTSFEAAVLPPPPQALNTAAASTPAIPDIPNHDLRTSTEIPMLNTCHQGFST